jgi:transcriptional regulator with XRE-family HTH domain
MRREEQTKAKIQHCIVNESKYEFPDFLSLLRQCHNLTRRTVAEDTGVNKMQQYYLEKGDFCVMPKIHHLVHLADYYGVDDRLLKKKAHEFLQKKKGAND